MKVITSFEVEDICEDEDEMKELIEYYLKQGLLSLSIENMEINYE